MGLTDITIGITSFLRPGYVQACLDGIFNNLPECKVIVADDSDGTAGREKFAILMPFDSGLSAKRNALVQATRTKYWLSGHDDFDFSTPEAREGLKTLVEVLDWNPNIDVAGGRVHNNPYEGFLEYVEGAYIREHPLRPDGLRPFYPVDLTVNYFLARTDRIVPWDERMKIGGEHGDWFLEMKFQGRKTVWVPNVSITTLQLGDAPEVQDPRYGQYRQRAVSLGHRIFKEKRNIKQYIGFGGDSKPTHQPALAPIDRRGPGVISSWAPRIKHTTVDHPRKADGIEIHAVGDECAVYETAADRIHYLNPTAALILEFCDGNRSAAEIAALVQEAYGLPDAPLDEVNGCLNSLKETGIVC
jgi:hypothetical protein